MKQRKGTGVAVAAAATAAALIASPLRAQVWQNPAGGEYTDGANWVGGQPATDPSLYATFSNDMITTGTITMAFDVGNLGASMLNHTGTITFDLGPTRTWSVGQFLIMGDNTGAHQNPSLILTSGTFDCQLALIGNDPNATGHVTVTGPNAHFNATKGNGLGNIEDGVYGSNSTMLMNNGAQSLALGLFVGLQVAQHVDLTITDPGTKMNILNRMQVAGANQGATNGGNNTVNILNGGELDVGNFLEGVGDTTAVNGSTITISGSGSKLVCNGYSNGVTLALTNTAARVGFHYSDNYVTVQNGGQFIVKHGDMTIGENPVSSGNVVQMSDGTMDFQAGTLNTGSIAGVGAGTGRIDVQRGTLRITGGVANVPGLQALLSGSSTIQLSGGTITVNNGTIANGAPLLVGDGSGATMTYRMGSQTGSLQVANGLVVQSDGRLEGASTIIGDVTDNNIWSTGTGAGTSKVVGNLTLSSTGTVDLANNSLIVSNATAQSYIQGKINNARNNGNWNQPGITSSAAAGAASHNTTLGVLSGAEYTSVGGTGTFAGLSYADTDTLVKYTYYGDTDFNGRVNFDDYVRTDNGFNNHLSGWLNGDFDGNGQVNFDDYVLIDLAFNTQSGTLGRALSFLDGSDRSLSEMNDPALRKVVDHFDAFGNDYAGHFLMSVPEPTSVCLALGLSIPAVLRRRRHYCRSDAK